MCYNFQSRIKFTIMRTFLTLSFALALHSLTNAQNISDIGFAQGIRNHCPACIDANGNLTPAADTLKLLSMIGYQIRDLTGVEYFSSLETLSITYGEFSVLPTLPRRLKNLTCTFGLLTQVTNLPNGLKSIDLSYNLLTNLFPLPDAINYLDISNNHFSDLFYRFPDSLTQLNVSGNQIANFSILGGRRIQTLYADGCQIERVSNLPPNLTYLQMNYNNLSVLPDLPLSIEEFWVENNDIMYVSELINLTNLRVFSLESNDLVLLPDLPPNLQNFNVANNNLTSLPNFPHRLKGAYFVNNQIAEWPVLNDSLENVYASYNLLNEVPRRLPNLYSLTIDFNIEIACIEYLPPTLIHLNTRGTDIQCLPNFVPPLNEYPLQTCDQTNNANNCAIISTINHIPAPTFTVSPNPCKDYLTVQNSELLDDNSQLYLYDNLGQLVKNQTVNVNNPTVDVADLQAAVYYLMIKTAKGSYSQKIVKQ